MTKVIKNGTTMVARDRHQLAAFINNGWSVVNEETVAVEQETESEQNQYSKTTINRMSTAELQALATEQGINNANDITGGELKRILIDKFNL